MVDAMLFPPKAKVIAMVPAGDSARGDPAIAAADIDGDGVPEDVPYSDKAGTSAPVQVYTLTTTTTSSPTSKTVPLSPRFYLGGSIYEDWASVPNRYKVPDPDRPEASRSTASVFKFVW